MTSMNFIGLDIHKKTISYCVKDAAGAVLAEGTISSRRQSLDDWIRTLHQPWTVAMEATMFTSWIYDHLLPHAAAVKVAHPLMLRAVAASKKKTDLASMRAGLPIACDATSSRSVTWLRRRFANDAGRFATTSCQQMIGSEASTHQSREPVIFQWAPRNLKRGNLGQARRAVRKRYGSRCSSPHNRRCRWPAK